MALSSGYCYYSSSCPISTQFRTNRTNSHSVDPRNAVFGLTSSNSDDVPKPYLSVLADSSSAPKARFVARRTESISVRPLKRPLCNALPIDCLTYEIHSFWFRFLEFMI
ncbi:hypothetical protein R6Q59_030617 [Mikania micrantha]